LKNEFGRKIINLSHELNCDVKTLSCISALIMFEHGLVTVDVQPSLDEIVSWIERNKDVIKKELEDLKEL